MADEHPDAKLTNCKLFAGGAKKANTGSNSPAYYPAAQIQPVLKPILERFDFVKLKGFSADFAVTMILPKKPTKKGGGITIKGKLRHGHCQPPALGNVFLRVFPQPLPAAQQLSPCHRE